MPTARARLFVTILLAMLVLATCNVWAQIITQADAYVTSASAGTNFGSSTSLVVQSGGSYSYIRFDLSRIPTVANGAATPITSSMVSKATLRLFVTAVTANGTFDVWEVGGTSSSQNWSESTITYTSQSSYTFKQQLATGVPISYPTPNSKNQYIIIDITPAVKDWLDNLNNNGGQYNNGIVLKPSSGSSISVSFSSKEDTTSSHDPELNIIFDTSLSQISGQIGPSQVSQGYYNINVNTATTATTALSAASLYLSPAPSVCTGNYFAKGIDIHGGALCFQPTFGNLGGSAIAAQLPAAVVYNNQNNIFGAGSKQTFTASSNYAGLNIAGVNSNPTSPATGDVWFRLDLNHLQFKTPTGLEALAFSSEVTAANNALNSEITRAQGAEATLQTNINNEAAARQAADTTLQNNVNSEATARAAADATLQTNINNEAAVRAAADITLQNNINAETARATGAEATITGNLNSEIARATAAENTKANLAGGNTFTGGKQVLAGAAVGYASLNVPGSGTAPTTLAAGDVWLSNGDPHLLFRDATNTTQMLAFSSDVSAAQSTETTALNNEITRATNAENTLTTNLNAEISNRQAAVSAEAAARAAADVTLQGNINAETLRATNAETALGNSITAETNRATAAENTKANLAGGNTFTTGKQVLAAADTGYASLKVPVATNPPTTLTHGDVWLGSDPHLQFQTATGTESLAFSSEVTSANSAITAEATRAEAAEATLTTNLSNETSRAQGAEATLTTNLSNESTRAQGAESTLTTNLNAEISNRQAAVTAETTRATTAEGALTTSIAAESTRAQGAEAGLNTAIGNEVTRATAAESALSTGKANLAGGNLFIGGKQTLAASTSGYAPLNIPTAGSAPSAPALGDLWLTSGDAHLWFQDKNNFTHSLMFTDDTVNGANLSAGSVSNTALASSTITVSAGAGLSGGGSVALGGSTTLSIPTGGVTNAMLANSSVTVSAGTGLSGGGTVALGGTTTLNNTGILSLTGSSNINVAAGQNPAISLTGTVPIANGGTGLNTAPNAANQFLRSSGSAWTIGTILTSDLPSLSATYVDLSSAQTIGGTKTFSSTISGSINGNAATVTNGVYTTGSYPDPGWITTLSGAKISGNISGNAASITGNISDTQVTGLTADLAAATASAVTTAEAFSSNASNLSSGTAARSVLPGTVVYSDTATNYTAGKKQTFVASASTAGLSVDSGTAADPTGLASGDLWFNTTSGHLKFSPDGTAVHQLMYSDDTISNGQLSNSSITVSAGTGISVSGSPVALGGTVTVNNTGVLSSTAGTGISITGTAANPIVNNTGVLSVSASGPLSSSGGQNPNITLGTVAIANGGTGQTTANAGFNALSPMSTLGDVIHGGAAGAGTRLAGNTTTTKQFLTQTGTGALSAAPVWGAITAGDIPSLSATYVDLTSTQTITGAKTFSSASNSFTGSGAGLTALNGTNISSGTVADARLSANVALLNGTQTFSGVNTFSSASNSFTGSGAGLTSLNASNLSSGTVPSAVFSGTYGNVLNLSNGSNTISGTFTGNITGNVSGSAASFTGSLAGDVTGTQGATVVAKVHGTTVPTNAAADQTIVTTASAVGSWASIPSCGDATHALAYSTGGHTFSCQAITGSGGTVTTFSAGNATNLFTSSVTSPNSTPDLLFTLSNAPAHTFFGNNTVAAAAPAYLQPSAGDLSNGTSGSGAVLLGTSPLMTNATINQAANGNDALSGKRATDSTPTGNLMHFTNNAGGTDLWRVDAAGVLQAGSIPGARIAPTRTSASTTVSGAAAGATATATLTCPAGVLLGGGAQAVSAGGAGTASIYESYPSSGTVWTGSAVQNATGHHDLTATAWVVCSGS